jgi:hypothetical protein
MWKKVGGPCGTCGGSGSRWGTDQPVCVPSGLASAYDTYGTGVGEWKSTHIA